MFWRWNHAGTNCFLRRGKVTIGTVYAMREGGYRWHLGYKDSRVDGPGTYATVTEAADALMDHLELPR